MIAFAARLISANVDLRNVDDIRQLPVLRDQRAISARLARALA
jgi:hypothetical protein